MASGIKLTYDEVRDFFIKQGCELLENEYKNARTRMRYRCSCGNESQIVFDSFRRGNRCRNCGNVRSSEKQSYDHETARKKFAEIGCELLDEYKGSSVRVKFRCSCGEVSDGLPNNIWRRKRCGKCGVASRSGKNHYMWYDDRDEFAQLRSFKDRCHKLITMVLNVTGRVKNKKSALLLGYDYKQLQEHIRRHPNWDKVKCGKWHIDHIFPIKAFVDHGISDLKIINALDNLRPVDAIENLRKNAKYDKLEFAEYLKTKGVVLDVSSDNGI